MQAATNTSYQRLLEDSLLPYVSKQIENLLIDPPQPNNLEAIYETLKAYLMLHEPEHFNAEFLSGFIGATFTQELGASIPKEQREKLGITDGLVRLYCGIEDKEDLMADIAQALDALS